MWSYWHVSHLAKVCLARTSKRLVQTREYRLTSMKELVWKGMQYTLDRWCETRDEWKRKPY